MIIKIKIKGSLYIEELKLALYVMHGSPYGGTEVFT